MSNIKLPFGNYSFGGHTIEISNNGNKLTVLSPYYRENVPWNENFAGYAWNGVLLFTFTNTHATIYGEGGNTTVLLSPPIATASGDPFITPLFY